MKRAIHELELAMARNAARYRIGGPAAARQVDLEAVALRAVDRALDDAFAPGDERRALRAVARWEVETASLMCGGPAGRIEGS